MTPPAFLDSAGPQRIGVVDFVAGQLPFMLGVAERLAGRAEFSFFQPRPQTHRLLAGHRLHTPETTEATPLDWTEAELVTACGPHECAWAESLPALLAEARPLAAKIQAFLQRERIDCVVVWNGAPLARSLAAHCARRLGLRLVHCENGYLPGTMQLDRRGVNFFSEHTPAIAAGVYRGAAYDGAALDAALELLREGREPADAVPLPSLKAPLGERLQRELARLFSRRAWRWVAPMPREGRMHDRVPAGSGPYVLLPLQVVRDSQLSVHSPLLGADFGRLVGETWLALRQVRPGVRLVVKLHPRETNHGNRAHRRIAAKFPDIVFVQQQPIVQLLLDPDCLAAVTINSTVGVEAMACGKPVVTLGRNFYTVPALAHVVEQIDLLPAALVEALTAPRDPAAIRDFLGYLHQTMQVRGSHLDLSARSLDAIAARFFALASGRQGPEAEPE